MRGTGSLSDACIYMATPGVYTRTAYHGDGNKWKPLSFHTANIIVNKKVFHKTRAIWEDNGLYSFVCRATCFDFNHYCDHEGHCNLERHIVIALCSHFDLTTVPMISTMIPATATTRQAHRHAPALPVCTDLWLLHSIPTCTYGSWPQATSEHLSTCQ